MSKSGYEFAKAVIAKNKAIIEAAKQQDKKEVAKIVRTPARSYKKSNNRSKSSGSNGSSSSNSSKTNSGNVNQGVATQNQGSNAPPGFQAPPPPTNTVYDYVSRDNNTNISDSTIKKIDDAPESPMNNQNVETVNDTLPYYTLITSTRSVDPGVTNPVTKKNIRGTSTTDKAWEQGGRQTTEFVNRVAVTGLAAGTVGAAVALPALSATAAGTAAIGLGKVGTGIITASVLSGVGATMPTVSQEAWKLTYIGSQDQSKVYNPELTNAMNYANQRAGQEAGMLTNLARGIPGVGQIMDYDKTDDYIEEYFNMRGNLESKEQKLRDYKNMLMGYSFSETNKQGEQIEYYMIGDQQYSPSEAREWKEGKLVEVNTMLDEISSVKTNFPENTYTDKEIQRMGDIGQELLVSRALGDVTGTIMIETGSEILGRTFASSFFTKVSGSTVQRVTKSALLSLPIAGFMEGSMEYTKEQLSHNQPVKLWDTYDIGPVSVPGGFIGTGALGSAFATLIGTPIARNKMIGNLDPTGPGAVAGYKADKWLLYARIADPFEIFGDLGGDVIMKGSGRNFIGRIRSFTPAGSNSNAQVNNIANNISNAIFTGNSNSTPIIDYSQGSITVTSSTTSSNTSIMNPVSTPVSVNNLVPTNTLVNTTSNVTITDISPGTPVPVEVNPNNITPVDTAVDVPVDIPAYSEISTQAPVDVPVNIPVSTLVPRLPIIPVSGGGGHGSRGYGGFSLGKFYDFKEFKVPELSALFKSASAPTTTKKKTKKRRSRKKKDPLKELLGDIKI